MRAIVNHRGSAVMMPVDARGRILLVRQYRLPARHWKKLVSFFGSPGYVAEKMTIFVATGLTGGARPPPFS